MMTFRSLLLTLGKLSDEQLDQEIRIIPTGYCSDVPVNIDGYSPFAGEIDLAISDGDIIFDDGSDAPACCCSVAGCFDSGECEGSCSSEGDVVLKAHMPYLRISNE